MSLTGEAGNVIGRHVELRPIRQEDLPWLYEIATAPQRSFRWRYRGATPPHDRFVANLWDGVLAQYVVVDRSSGRSLGLVVLYAHAVHGQHAYVAALGGPSDRSGMMIEASALLIEYSFRTWNLRKIYVETLEFNLTQFARLDALGFQLEGRLAEHEWHDGRWWDLLTFAIYRDVWREIFESYRHILVAGSGPSSQSST